MKSTPSGDPRKRRRRSISETFPFYPPAVWYSISPVLLPLLSFSTCLLPFCNQPAHMSHISHKVNFFDWLCNMWILVTGTRFEGGCSWNKIPKVKFFAIITWQKQVFELGNWISCWGWWTKYGEAHPKKRLVSFLFIYFYFFPFGSWGTIHHITFGGVCRWISSSSAFLNEPPVIEREGPQYKYAAQYHVANMASTANNAETGVGAWLPLRGLTDSVGRVLVHNQARSVCVCVFVFQLSILPTSLL